MLSPILFSLSFWGTRPHLNSVSLVHSRAVGGVWYTDSAFVGVLSYSVILPSYTSFLIYISVLWTTILRHIIVGCLLVSSLGAVMWGSFDFFYSIEMGIHHCLGIVAWKIWVWGTQICWMDWGISILSCWGWILPLCILWFSGPIFLDGGVSWIFCRGGKNLCIGSISVVLTSASFRWPELCGFVVETLHFG